MRKNIICRSLRVSAPLSPVNPFVLRVQSDRWMSAHPHRIKTPSAVHVCQEAIQGDEKCLNGDIVVRFCKDRFTVPEGMKCAGPLSSQASSVSRLTRFPAFPSYSRQQGRISLDAEIAFNEPHM